MGAPRWEPPAALSSRVGSALIQMVISDIARQSEQNLTKNRNINFVKLDEIALTFAKERRRSPENSKTFGKMYLLT
mgnify:CR=1 FL=1